MAVTPVWGKNTVCSSRWDRIVTENGKIALKRYSGKRDLRVLFFFNIYYNFGDYDNVANTLHVLKT